MNTKNLLSYFLLALFFTGIYSCGSDAFKPDLSDTPTSGHLNICLDESFSPLLSAQAETFLALYKNANINLRTKTETEVFNDLMNDSCKVIVVGRELSNDQLKYFEQKKVMAKTLKIAVDALAFIVNADNPDSLFTASQIKDIITGKLIDWKNISSGNNLGSIAVVFDKAGSSNTRYLSEKFLNKQPFPSNCFALQSNNDVINYVQHKKNAIGIIGVSWISDSNDTTAMSFLHKVKVVAIKNDDSQEFTDYYKPFQAYIALHQYPFTRDVFLINRQARNGLGTGFASFVAGDQGQRIVRLKGLLPATMPIRLVKTGN